jgi:tRNA modification GTPase
LIAVLTPPGRGAVATLGVRGPRAVEIVAQRFAPLSGQPLATFPAGRVLFGRFQLSGTATEELVVGLVAASEVEVHTHGGLAAVEAVAAALVAEGAERIEWPAWAALTEPDRLAAEALVALSEARTQRTAGVLLDQYRGALRGAVEQVAAAIHRTDFYTAAAALRKILSRAEFGQHLTRPWRVVLAGRPNAGKSSLMNALLGFQRSIVFAEPGTTRDVLTATTALGGWPVELVDTAGLRTSSEPIEAEGVARAQRQVREADLVLLVCDVTADWSNDDRDVLAAARQTLVIHHKCDLAEPPSDGRPAGPAVSSLTGQGIDDLCRAIAARLVPDPPQPGEAVPLGPRQVGVLEQALAAVERREGQSAAKLLAELIGMRTSPPGSPRWDDD